MKKLFLTIVAVAIPIIVAQKSVAAIVVQDITDTEFNTLIATHEAAWSVVYRGGGTSGAGSEEIRVTRYRDEGNQTLIDDITWSSTNDLEVLLDSSGNISARANSVTVTAPEFGVTRPYNQVLILIHDRAPFGSVNEFQDIEINGYILNNMFADGNGFPGDSDAVAINGFGSQAPFSLNGVWNPGISPAVDDQYVSIFAINNTTIPEPSTALLIGFAHLLLLRRRR